MFFDDPVSAFGNILNALAADGRLTFICWRPLEENPWMGVPLGVTCEFVAPPEVSPPGAPGHFQLADEDRARQILEAAGYAVWTAGEWILTSDPSGEGSLHSE